jgi:hypothetical protein
MFESCHRSTFSFWHDGRKKQVRTFAGIINGEIAVSVAKGQLLETGRSAIGGISFYI